MKRAGHQYGKGRARRGFTLVEMVITLAIFLLLAGAVFGIMTGVLKAAAVLQDNQGRRDEVVALQEFLRHALDGLPDSARVNSYRRNDGEGLTVNGIVFGTSGLLTALDAKRQNNGLYTIRVARFSASMETGLAMNFFLQSVTADDDSLAWRSLMRDVKSVDWKFLAPDSTVWQDEWPPVVAGKPNLIRFTLLPAGELQSTATEVWLPPITAPPLLTGSTNSAATP